MKYNNCEFHVGDEVETVDGMTGKIVLICDCEKCAERGFFEPKWETSDGKYSDYITAYQANYGFPDYRRIGKYVWNHDIAEEKSMKNVSQKENKKMKEIKLTIDGKEVKLTNEQLKALGIKVGRRNPFERVSEFDPYYYIDAFDEVQCFSDNRDRDGDESFNCINYFNDKEFAEQVALHQLLYRKLLKFAYDNECEDTTEWDDNNSHWSIRYSTDAEDFEANDNYCFKHQDVYFSSKEAAERAIKEVVEPFVRKYPEFVW